MSVRRRSGMLLGALLLVATTALPVAAATPPSVHAAADAAAYGGRLIVVWKAVPPSSLRVAGVASTRATARFNRTVVATRPGRAAAVAASLRKDPRVLAVVPDAKVQASDWPTDGSAPNDPYASVQTDLAQVRAQGAWTTTTGDASVVVAVIDTGLDTTHPDLAGIHVVAPRNEITDTTDVTDDFGHGTHVTGTIAAATDNGIGIAGIAPGVSIMPVKVLDDTGAGSFADVMDGVEWAASHGASVINMSLGASDLDTAEQSLLQTVIDDAHDAGALVVAAAGNSGMSLRSYPASLNHVVSVAAVDALDRAADFSTYNPAVDIAAPGVSILSTLPGNLYEFESGTSMASPHVAAIAALVRSARPGLTPDEVEAVLRSSARDGGAPGYDVHFGDGIVDATAALAAPVPDPLPALDPPATSFALAFTSPATNVIVRPTPSYDLALAASGDIDQSLMAELWWASPGNRCPSMDAEPQDYASTEFSLTPTALDIRDSMCVRMYAAALGADGTIAEATSPAIIGADRTAPKISYHNPGAGQARVNRAADIMGVMSEPVTGVSSTTVRLRDTVTGHWVAAKVTYSARWLVFTINPVHHLLHNRIYQVVIRPGIRDRAGNALRATTWRFTTHR